MNDASVKEFLLDETWNVIPWEDLSDEELQDWWKIGKKFEEYTK